VTSFISFLAIGGLVGLATLLIREAIAWLLPADLPLWYGVSVVLAYSVGIVLSFFLQGRVTFSQRPSELTLGHFSRFAAVAISGALVALVASLGVRYFFVLDRLIGHRAAAAAFAVGALIAAVFNYGMTSRFVFRIPARRAVASRSADAQHAQKE
jgi:putative flippase GtrA